MTRAQQDKKRKGWRTQPSPSRTQERGHFSTSRAVGVVQRERYTLITPEAARQRHGCFAFSGRSIRRGWLSAGPFSRLISFLFSFSFLFLFLLLLDLSHSSRPYPISPLGPFSTIPSALYCLFFAPSLFPVWPVH
ncbi:hypothetical protein MAPG_02019 [Magnaporthiopsis poae ATCC 64411]|uniref:Transmembrane protein n=1 Tax=Magnaporthiopsis poae (strain ATCC 64411 / 73-15) TaxID=644358 RepID=A0A0C4DQ81_MAGP6|nr:hypothetical protein MAPG_02019 [Magnaporthiopsis poae ATCC 64411]